MISVSNYEKRNNVLSCLFLYEKYFLLEELFLKEERDKLNEIRNFIKTDPHCFCSKNPLGHVTASAFVVNRDFSMGLFTFHKQFKKWIQLGGHCLPNEFYMHDVALREAKEESGLENLCFVDSGKQKKFFEEFLKYQTLKVPFDIDIHKVFQKNKKSMHKHYDLRYVLMANCLDQVQVSSESLDLRWITFRDILHFTHEKSVLRQIEKLQLFRTY
jgi:hypothetical protein